MSETEARQSHLESAFRQYATKYFEIHAQQRIKAFQFFVTLSTAIGGGAVYSLENDNPIALLVLGVVMCFVSFVFRMLDVRTRTLVKNGEEALKYLDSLHDLPKVHNLPSPLSLFERDDEIRRRNRNFNTCFSYRICFGMAFGMFFLFGLGAVVFSIFGCRW